MMETIKIIKKNEDVEYRTFLSVQKGKNIFTLSCPTCEAERLEIGKEYKMIFSNGEIHYIYGIYDWAE